MPTAHSITKRDGGPGHRGSKLGRILTHDYRSPLDPYLRWLRTPLACLNLAAIAATLCGLCLHPQGFVLAFGLSVILAAGVSWPWLSLRGLSGTLEIEATRGREGEPIAVRLRVCNRVPWGAWGLTVRGFTPDASGATEPGAAVAHAGGGRTTEARWVFVPRCRGEYPTGRPALVTAFPFGLWESRRALTATGTVLVWPRTFPPGPIPEAAGPRSVVGPVTSGRAGDGGDFAGVRPYRRGDSPRRIHWPQTARHGHLIVCERQSHDVPWIQVVLDTDPQVHSGTGPDGSREWAIRIAASLLEGWLAQGARMDLVLGAQVLLAPAGVDPKRRALDALARIPAGGPPLQVLLDLPVCRRFEGGLCLVVTTDRGLATLPARLARAKGRRFAALVASGFDPGAGGPRPDPATLPARPWIWFEEPARVAERLRTPWKEVPDAS